MVNGQERPAGWYPDERYPDDERWWDGARWGASRPRGDHRRASRPLQDVQDHRFYRQARVIVPVAVLVLFIGLSLLHFYLLN